MNSLDELLTYTKYQITENMNQYIPSYDRIHEAMHYAMKAGGKRIRPALLYAILDIYGSDKNSAHIAALSLEMIHTYSLVHDDLPAMDDDDLRRGKNTVHIEFDEATAILAGDGLLNHAFTLLTSMNYDSEIVLDVIRVISEAASIEGMILGQSKDIQDEVDTIESLNQLHALKTGRLLSAPVEVGVILSGAKQDLEQWRTIAYNIGLMFQIKDDYLDVYGKEEEIGKRVGSDASLNKTTYITLIGQEETNLLLQSKYDETVNLLKELNHLDTSLIEQIMKYVVERKK